MIITQFYDLATTTLGAPSKPVELKIGLWVAAGTTNHGNAASSGVQFLDDGYSSIGISTDTAARLHTLSSKWSSATNFAFEATLYEGTSGNTAYAGLWDFTSSTAVSGSTVSTTSTTATVLRSSQFTLTPGHVYGVCVWSSNTSYTTYICDASLIVFP